MPDLSWYAVFVSARLRLVELWLVAHALVVLGLAVGWLVALAVAVDMLGIALSWPLEREHAVLLRVVLLRTMGALHVSVVSRTGWSCECTLRSPTSSAIRLMRGWMEVDGLVRLKGRALAWDLNARESTTKEEARVKTRARAFLMGISG